MTQGERLAKREAIRSEVAKLEAGLRALLEEEKALLKECAHTYPNGQSALVGASTKVCVHCGKLMNQKDEKLWG
jgi:hypothetical protein